jgi:ABC-2 type transport system ATP-binding protein
MAQEENVGVLLTSHDAGDLEALCKRVIIINHGQIVYEDRVSNLKRRFLTSKLVEVRYADEVPVNFSLDGAEVLKVGHYGVKLRFDTRHTGVDRIMAALSARGQLVDITISDPPLEEVIARIYETEFAPSPVPNGDDKGRGEGPRGIPLVQPSPPREEV